MFAKSFAFVFIVLCLLVRGNAVEVDMKVKNKCLQEHHLTAEEVEVLRRAENPPENFKCYVKCMLIGLEIMNEAGEITEEVPEHLKKEREHFPDCKDVPGADLCERAFNFKNCVMKYTYQQDGTPA